MSLPALTVTYDTDKIIKPPDGNFEIRWVTYNPYNAGLFRPVKISTASRSYARRSDQPRSNFYSVHGVTYYLVP